MVVIAEQRDARAGWSELADALEARNDEFAHAEAVDAGKPFALARDIEIPRAVSNLRFFAHAATQFASESHHGEAGLNYTLRLPLGVVGCISPWNSAALPVHLEDRAALAAGNTVVAKPSEVTPRTATMLAAPAAEIGFPAGVLNSRERPRPERGRGHRPASRHQGDQFHRQQRGRPPHRRASPGRCSRRRRWSSAARMRPSCSPTAIGASTSTRSSEVPSRTAGRSACAVRACWSSAASTMNSATPSSNACKPCASAIRWRPGRNSARWSRRRSSTRCWPASNAPATKAAACSAAARLDRAGWFIAPTVIDGLGPECATNREEIFGPVVTLQAFDSDDDALALANASDYGLSATLFTNDLSRAHRLAAGCAWGWSGSTPG